MHQLATELFPICRSITGDGVRQTLQILQQYLPQLTRHEIPSGTRCFDWIIPPEWNIRDAYMVTPDGRSIARFQDSNLHVVNYSIPVDTTLSLDELRPHLHTLPNQPDAIPYITSYYQPYWGFCLSHNEYLSLQPGQYWVHIDSTLVPGSLTYGEWLLPGEQQEEIFLSTYICHPSLGNNELSGPVVTTWLARWLASLPRRRYSYRVVFIPETIGAIVYLSRHLEQLRRRVVAGFNITCIGDERGWSYLPSRQGDTLADRVARHVLHHLYPDFTRYSFLDRGSDERQYCSPGVDLPVVSVMRSKYGCYPEYHTSKDDLTLITPKGLHEGYRALQHCLDALEHNHVLQTTTIGEPQLGRRGLRPTLSTGPIDSFYRNVSHLLAFADGRTDLLQIADTLQQPLWSLEPLVDRLLEEQLLVMR
ncbi:MAG: DUF4910 domain-containing protein [Magnetococcales bacterium]|nr:DUF4910 domain-containing protein [Magnetococcales bacterium]